MSTGRRQIKKGEAPPTAGQQAAAGKDEEAHSGLMGSVCEQGALCAECVCKVCVYVHAHMQHSMSAKLREQSQAWALAFHLNRGSRDWIQVTRLAWREPLPTEPPPSCHLQFEAFECCLLSNYQNNLKVAL